MSMSTDSVYERLADALDRLSNGFPRTPSHAEIPLLEKIFSVEEATLAGQIGERAQSAESIATGAGMEPGEAKQKLLKMAEHGLVWVEDQHAELRFRLAPFIVGIYEAQLTRMDPRLARLVDAYMEDGGALGIMGAEPALHRVVPAAAAIKPEWILPYDDVRAVLEAAKSFKVRDCICRVQMDQTSRACDFPLRTCLIYYTKDRPASPDDVSREEALAILDEAQEIGLVHSVCNVRTGALLPEGIGYVCNCCGCCCVVLRGITKWGVANSVAHAAYYARINQDDCTDCGNCVDRCHVDAIAEQDGRRTVVRDRCIGCGLCVTGCPTGAAQLLRKPDEDIVVPPLDFADWQTQRRLSRQSKD